MEQDATNRTKETANRADRISEFTERSWGYRLIRGTYHIEGKSQRLLTSSPTENDATEKQLNKDFEEYG